MMTFRAFILAGGLATLLATAVVFAENIDPYEDGSQYGYGENVGWLNFEPGQGPGVTVSGGKLTGFVWAENIGWINLDPNFGGVTNDGTGLLSGYAWGENVGWINFNPKMPSDPNYYGVTIDDEGNFSGWAWGENIGWIHFQSVEPAPYKVRACVVTLEDLANFAMFWLVSGDWLIPADLNQSNNVDFVDYSILASYWLDYCPDGWQLKLIPH
jgi:hypothetical protein